MIAMFAFKYISVTNICSCEEQSRTNVDSISMLINFFLECDGAVCGNHLWLSEKVIVDLYQYQVNYTL